MEEYEGVEDTLFIPLTGRVYVSKKFPEYFFDEKALEMENLIKNKQIENKSSEYTMLANVARSYNLDEMAQKFIDKHDKCNIVNLGVGLETSYYRIDRKNSLFFEVDLPEVIELRKKYFEVAENEKFIKGDLFKLEWCDELDTNLPTLMIVAGVFQYFHEEDILDFIGNVKKIFRNAELIFDATNKFGIKYCNLYVKRTGNKSALMYFYIEDANEFSKKANCQLIECRGFYKDAIKILNKKLGLYAKIAMKIADKRDNAMILHLKI
ncbi:conjugal transfer protein [Methanobrevibacter sp. YE315]|uniref:class I SAM-dependent methyltransferase n=1 Tax=Methanobrevibacter sp. YE315 TaxID=1609968 RepID=UPI000764F047|nr:class I SAM-dependent methyltransferase [Methanobrevibacter sp. YE315]AMD17213.1 conjugal transfer protein [Methanobrevibacter sp. YE315]